VRKTGTRAVLAASLRNRDLRRVSFAFMGCAAAEQAVWIAVLVYAYARGGAPAASLAAVVQLIPTTLFAPFAARFADQGAPGRVLTAGYLAQAATMGATAVALLAGAPPAVVYLFAGAAASAVTITRPAQAAVVPGLVRGLDELTSANVLLGWIESMGLLVAPAVAGAIMAVSQPGTVFVVMAAVALVSAALVAPIAGPKPEPAAAMQDADAPSALAELAEGLRVIAGHPSARALVAILTLQFVLIGALDVLFVVLAIDVLDLGGSGAGYLNAAFGAGGVIGIVLTVRLIGRAPLAPSVVGATLAWSASLLVLGVWPTVVGAFVLLAAAGTARIVQDVAARTLLQRTAPAGVLARVFGVLETLNAIGLAVGSMLVPLLVALLGPAAAAAGLAALAPLVLLAVVRRLKAVDADADVPLVEIALLRSHALFAALSAPVVEGVARELTPVALTPGDVILREGQPGERYYVIADGRLDVTQRGKTINTVGRGEGVGEISLLKGVPCTATVTAETDVQLHAIEAQTFIDVVTGHATADGNAQRVMRERLARGS
jgi:hypothetical protein